MAGSRLEKFGTVFTRTHFMSDQWPRDMGRKKRLSSTERMTSERNFMRCMEQGPELLISPNPALFQHANGLWRSTREFESQGELEKQSLFEETGKALLAEGLGLRRRGIPAVAA